MTRTSKPQAILNHRPVAYWGQRQAMLWLAILAAWIQLPTARAAAQAQRRGPEVRISPNAIQKSHVPMTIDLMGAPGQTVYLFVLRSCDRNPATPELRGHDNCKTPLWARQITLDSTGQKRTDLTFSRDIPDVPRNVRLWLRASNHKDGKSDYQDAVFGLLGDPCSIWQTLSSLFAGDRCPIGVKRAVGPQRGIEDLPDVALEIRRLVITQTAEQTAKANLASVSTAGVEPAAKPISVPGTHNASGLAQQRRNHRYHPFP
ncbi:MAG: hypothetical protein MJE77_29675 [Proteobacteria bacterium]|nr:hypothetical protein [Pseudomonadota bacterium]